MSQKLILHYAPDNASLCVRLALLEAGIGFDTQLVDRAQCAQKSDAFLALNPNGLIPVLMTPNGPLHETGACLLWIADHAGDLMPDPLDRGRGDALKWLFWLSNTLHPALRMLFYPDHYIDNTSEALRAKTRARLCVHLTILNTHADWLSDGTSSILACYLAPMLRWAALYGGDTQWFDLSAYPRLLAFAQSYEIRDAAIAAATSEGLGPTPFSNPSHPNPPQGSAI